MQTMKSLQFWNEFKLYVIGLILMIWCVTLYKLAEARVDAYLLRQNLAALAAVSGERPPIGMWLPEYK